LNGIFWGARFPLTGSAVGVSLRHPIFPPLGRSWGSPGCSARRARCGGLINIDSHGVCTGLGFTQRACFHTKDTFPPKGHFSTQIKAEQSSLAIQRGRRAAGGRQTSSPQFHLCNFLLLSEKIKRKKEQRGDICWHPSPSLLERSDAEDGNPAQWLLPGDYLGSSISLRLTFPAKAGQGQEWAPQTEESNESYYS